MKIAHLGRVEVEPRTRLGLVKTVAGEHRLALAHGRIRATTLAPPRQFFIETPSGVAADLGCAFALETDAAGNGLLAVSSGWVAFERDGRESVVPAGGECLFRPEIGPGTPYRSRASDALRKALEAWDFENGGPAALSTVLAEARARDALTVWSLLARVSEPDRTRVLDRLLELAPPPPRVDRAAVLALDRKTLARWRKALLKSQPF